MTALRDASQFWSMIHVLIVFLLLFESRRPWRSTVILGFSAAGVMTVVTFVLAELLKLNPVTVSFFTCSLPSMALFFWISKYRDGRFFFLFCLSDTMCIWLIQLTALLDRLAGGGYVVMFISRLLLFPLAEWFIWRRLRRPYQELQRKLDRGWWQFSLIGLLYYMLVIMVALPVDVPLPARKELLRLLLVLALMPLTYLSILHSLWRQMRMYENVRMIEIQRQDYDALFQKIEVGRIYRYDMRHHLAAMEGLLQQGDYEGAQHYIRSLSGGLEELTEPARRTQAGGSWAGAPERKAGGGEVRRPVPLPVRRRPLSVPDGADAARCPRRFPGNPAPELGASGNPGRAGPFDPAELPAGAGGGLGGGAAAGMAGPGGGLADVSGDVCRADSES